MTHAAAPRWPLAAALALLVAPVLAVAAEDAPVPSALWERYRAQAGAGEATDLPDFSYAGYARGERAPAARGPVFDVRDFGARPDDREDDRDGIARAIQAAGAAGGGIVHLPRGRYLVNTRMAGRRPIPVEASGVTLRGDGCGAGGTIIHAIHPFDRGDDPSDPRRLHLGDTVLDIRSPTAPASPAAAEVLARLAAEAPRGAQAIEVDDARLLAPGAWVVLHARGRPVLTGMIAPYEVEEAWTSITQDRAQVGELHQVRAVAGSRVEFAEPIRYHLRGEHGWTVRRFLPIREVGVEDICFLGSAHQRYIHHRSDIDDSGWSTIKMTGVVDGWVRRCSFIDGSQTATVTFSANVSLLNLVIDGNQGHHGLRSMWFTHNVLGGLCVDRSGCTHGPSVSQGSIGTVYWRCRLGPDQPLDSHAGRPYASLFDRLDGGVLYGSTGGVRDFPQHLQDLVIWNLDHRAGGAPAPAAHYDFWRRGKSDRFIRPIIAGLHGDPATFNADHLGALESPGRRVSPDSLYEAQLALRLGGAPAWVAAARAEQAALLALPMPDHFSLAEPGRGWFPLPEDFALADLLRFLATRSLEAFNGRLFELTLPDPDLRLHLDQGMVRNAVYALMSHVYRSPKGIGRDGNRITAVAAEEDGAPVAVIRLHVRPEVTAQPGWREAAGWRDAATFAAQVGGRVRAADGLIEVVLPRPAP